MLSYDEKKLKERRRLAEKWVDALKALMEEEMYILLCPTGWRGVTYLVETKKDNGDRRIRLITVDPEKRETMEYLDYKPDPNDAPRDLRAFVISNGPFIFTQRVKPGFDDDPENFEFVITGRTADYYMNLRDDLIRKQNEIHQLMYELDEARAVIERQEREIEVMGEKVRVLEQDIEALSRENMLLKETITQLETVVKKYMALGEMSQAAVDEILRLARAAGVERVMGVQGKLTQILQEDEKIWETLVARASSGGEIQGQLIQTLREQQELIKQLQEEVKSLKELKEVKVKEVKSEGGS